MISVVGRNYRVKIFKEQKGYLCCFDSKKGSKIGNFWFYVVPLNYRFHKLSSCSILEIKFSDNFSKNLVLSLVLLLISEYVL
jgi:hypothetical protein